MPVRSEQTVTRTGEVMEAIRRRIASRALSTGERLPSIRGFAQTLGVSPSTVVDAYDRLAAEGLIRSRPGSGFFVAGRTSPLALADAEPPLDRAIDPLWVSRQALDAQAGTLRPGCGWLPADWMPQAAIRRALRELARDEDTLLADYGASRGSPVLRAALARRLADEGVEASPDRILLTISGTAALDLLCRFLLRPDDTVLVDDPCYFNFLAMLRAHRVKIVGVPLTPTGPDLEAFAETVAAHRPRLYVTNSALQNPTGATLSVAAAHRILTVATAHDMTIVEDDVFADLEPEPSPRLASLDGLNRVVRIGSFSKTLSASVRCGYVATRADWLDGLVDLQVATGFGGPSPLAAALVAHVLKDGSYRKHLATLQDRLARCRQEAASALAPLGIRPWTLPRGGFQLWCRLPEHADASEIARFALAKGVVLAPGNVFSVSQSAAGLMRFNVAEMSPPVLYLLGRALRAQGIAAIPDLPRGDGPEGP